MREPATSAVRADMMEVGIVPAGGGRNADPDQQKAKQACDTMPQKIYLSTDSFMPLISEHRCHSHIPENNHRAH